MNGLLQRVIRRSAQSINPTPLSRGRAFLHLNGTQAVFSAIGPPFSLQHRHCSSSEVLPTVELTMQDGQLTDVATASANTGTGHEPWVVVQGVQAVLEMVHTTTGLPWWATLLLSGVTLRAAIFPFYVLQVQALQRLMRARPDFAKLYSAYKYARTFTPSADRKGHLDAILLGRQGVKAVIKKYNTRPLQTIVGSVAYIPLFVLMAYSARDMVRSGNFAGFESGGFFVWQNLMEPDSTYVLPILAAMSTYGNLELTVRTKSGLWTTLLQGGQYLTILAVPIIATLPQGVFFYWFGASWSSMVQTIAMNNNTFRRRIGLKPRIEEMQSPAAGAAEMLGKAHDTTGGAKVVGMETLKSQQQ